MPVNPNDKRVVKTLELIERSFLKVMERKTLHDLSIQDVVEEANINRSTFYTHFEDKYVLFDHIVRKTFEQKVAEHLPDLGPYSPLNLGRLITATIEFFQYLNVQCPPADRQLRPIAESRVQEVLYDCLIRWFPSENPPEPGRKALFVSWALFGFLLEAVGNGKMGDLNQVKVQAAESAQAVLGL